MGTLNAIYVRATGQRAIALREEYPTAYTEPGLEFYAVEQSQTAWTPPEAELAALSARVSADVLWLTFQSVSDSFQFLHWNSGKHVRALVYGCFVEQGLWERVEGEPEPWERGAFFDPASLKLWREGADPVESAELERIWCHAEIAIGRTVPSIDARESARAVAEFYRLPGWS